MNKDNKVYEVIQNDNGEISIESYVISYSNCDYIYGEKIFPIRVSRIFERNKLDKFTELDIQDNVNKKSYGYTKKRELAETYTEKILAIRNTQECIAKVDELNETKEYYEHQIHSNRLHIATLDKKIESFY